MKARSESEKAKTVATRTRVNPSIAPRCASHTEPNVAPSPVTPVSQASPPAPRPKTSAAKPGNSSI